MDSAYEATTNNSDKSTEEATAELPPRNSPSSNNSDFRKRTDVNEKERGEKLTTLAAASLPSSDEGGKTDTVREGRGFDPPARVLSFDYGRQGHGHDSKSPHLERIGDSDEEMSKKMPPESRNKQEHDERRNSRETREADPPAVLFSSDQLAAQNNYNREAFSQVGDSLASFSSETNVESIWEEAEATSNDEGGVVAGQTASRMIYQELLDAKATQVESKEATQARPVPPILVQPGIQCVSPHLSQAFCQSSIPIAEAQLVVDPVIVYDRYGIPDLQNDSHQELVAALNTVARNSSAKDSTGFIMKPDHKATILSGMKRHSDSAAVQKSVRRLLLTLAHSSRNRLSIAKHGGVSIILAFMATYQKDACIQQYACEALRNLACNDDGASGTKWLPDEAAKVAFAGAVGPILLAMKTHPNEVGVQEQACRALCNLAVYNDDTQQSCDGISVVLSAMKMHPNEADLLRSACQTLWSLSRSADNSISIARLGGIGAILSAMKNHPNEAGLQEAALEALGSLSDNNEDNKVSIARLGGVATILSAVKSFPNEARLQQKACRALESLVARSQANDVCSTRS